MTNKFDNSESNPFFEGVELENSSVTKYSGRHYGKVEIPSFYLPSKLQELHRELAAKRHEVRKLENIFRRQLADWLNSASK